MGRVFFAAIIVGGFVLSSICSGYSGGSGTAEEPYRIANKADLLALAGTTADYTKCFILTADINMEGQVFTTAIIGAANFTGTFDGNNLKITNFTINGESNNYLGLFGRISSGGVVKNLGLENFAVNGSSYVGGLVGFNNGGSIINCSSTGNVTGGDESRSIGGLVGENWGDVNNCYSTGAVSGGYNSSSLGGLVGVNEGSINNCYSTSAVSDSSDCISLGGLVGYNHGSINNCYSTGVVSGSDCVGGLVGYNRGSISNCYSTGTVIGTRYVGGLVGYYYGGSISSCYFLKTSGPANGYGTPLTDEKMKQQASFIGWDFVGEVINGSNDIWKICEGTNYPRLRWQIPLGDFVCPDGVDFYDFAVLADQWLLEEFSFDVWPEGGDGIVNFFDWAVFANQWQITVDYESLADFADQWLKTGANCYIADIAPDGGDGIVNMLDLTIFAQHWLE